MKKKYTLDKLLIFIFAITMISTACSSKVTPAVIPSQSPIPAVTIQSTPTPSEIPPTITPMRPTTTPASIPVLQPIDYLLNVDELPVELYKSNTIEYLRPDGSITYRITFFNAMVGQMNNSITVAAQPYLNVPDDSAFGNSTIEDPLLGENSVAYESNGGLTYIFYKGNALVSISGNLSDNEITKRGELTLEEMVNLGKVIDERLPDKLQLSPIQFPEQLDQAEYDHYIKSLALAKQGSEGYNLIPTDTFLTSDYICLSMEFIEPPQSLMFAIFDVQDKLYVQKYHGSPCTPLISSDPGQFEMRVAINDKLVAILPFVTE